MIVPAKPLPSVRDFINPRQPTAISSPYDELLFFRLGRNALLSGLINIGLNPGDTVAVSAYYCESAVTQLRLYGLNIIYIDVDTTLQIDHIALSDTLMQHKIGAYIHTDYFGVIGLPEDILLTCIKAGVKVIVDYAHSFLSAHLDEIAARGIAGAVFSMRKTLPVPDGGALFLTDYNVREDIRTAPQRQAQNPLLDGYYAKAGFEKIAVGCGWPNLYSEKIRDLRVAFNKPTGTKHAALDKRANPSISNQTQLSQTQRPPSALLAQYLGDAAHLKEIASLRSANYQNLWSRIARFGVTATCPGSIGSAVPQALPVLDLQSGLCEYLRAKGVGAYRWPDSELPMEVQQSPHEFPQAQWFAKSVVCLPIHQNLNDTHFGYIAECVESWAKTKRDT